MSLVNDMLRDLNKRTPVSNKAARVHGAIQSSIESKRPRLRMGLIMAGGLLVGSLAGYFYFESMGVQVVQVPMAQIPSLPEPAQATVPTPAAAEIPAAPAPAPAQAAVVDSAAAPAVETTVEIRELALQPNGFTLLIATSQETSFDVLDRSANGLTLHIDGVDRYDRSGTTVPGMSLMLVSDGLDIGIELERAADFLVREDDETPEFDILITASYRPQELSEGEPPAAPQPEVAQTSVPSVPAAPVASTPAPASSAASSTGDSSAPVRVNRELSLEDRDRNNSQQALSMVQGGRLIEAYQALLAFLEENPAAHQSRETLAKILLAQQEFAQASTVIDEGLQQVPNYAAFKKIKARLLMQADDPAQALTLLRNVPPEVASDTEYHELLASLYQQGNLHQQAVSTYQDLLRIDRRQGRWWTGLGISLEAQDKDGDALASYQAALQTPNLDGNLRQFIQTRISNLGVQQ